MWQESGLDNQEKRRKKKQRKPKKQPTFCRSEGLVTDRVQPQEQRREQSLLREIDGLLAMNSLRVVKVRRIINQIWHIVAIAADIYYVSIGFCFCDYEILSRPI